MDKTTYIENIPFIELGGQVYNSSQTALISSFDTDLTFNPDLDYVEYHIYNGNKTLVDSINNLSSYNIYDNQVYINPESDLESRTPQSGQYYTLYNFLTPALSSSIQETYYISQISSNRTELRLSTTDILASDVAQSVNSLKELIETSPYYQDFYLNFGSNILILANNILLDDSDSTNPTVLIKLYEPLPENLSINSQCWAVQKIAESRAYLVNVQVTFDLQDPLIRIAGPNLNLKIKGQQNKTTQPVSTADLKNTNSKTLLYQLNSALNVPSVELNIDYTDFSNFIFFSSARTRLENFYYKLGLIEEYTYSGSISSESSSYYNSGSSGYWDAKIDEVITNFDGFEYALYYDSGSTTWPKSNSTPPYINVPTTSSEGLNWFESRLTVADTYDSDNKDLLVKSIPLYIQEDTANSNYELFVEMAGQLYDEVWLYTQAVTEKYNNTNGVNQGISKDLIGQTLRDFGIKLYQNNFTSDDLYSTYLGITPSGSLLPNTGQELIETYVTASATGSLIPIDDLSSEVYKRLYHNLPLLLKKKGTAAGLRTLINTYGIPDTILRINEFGGKDKNPNTWDYYQNEYDYAFNTSGDGFVDIPWRTLPLESSPSAFLALSTRLINPEYTGSALTIRRDSDNTELDIGFSSGELDTTTLLNFTGTGSGYVTQWYDQSPNNYTIIQTNATSQPLLVSSGSLNTINNRPALFFDGTNDEFRGPSRSIMGPAFASGSVSVYTVSQIATIFGRRPILSTFQTEGVFVVGFARDYNQNPNYGINTWSIPGGFPSNTHDTGVVQLNRDLNPVLHTVTYTYPSGSYYYTNGVLEASSATVPNQGQGAFDYLIATGNGLRVGSWSRVNAWYSGSISEIIIYTSDQLGEQYGINEEIVAYYDL